MWVIAGYEVLFGVEGKVVAKHFADIDRGISGFGAAFWGSIFGPSQGH